jgi:hypothetical protein
VATNLHLLLIALREPLDLRARRVSRIEALEPVSNLLAGAIRRQALELTEVLQHGADRLARIESPFLGQVSNPIPVGRRVGVARHQHAAAVWLDDVYDRPDECGLAGAIGTDQAEHLSAPHVEGHAIERQRLVETLGDPLDTNRDRRNQLQLSCLAVGSARNGGCAY